MDTTSKVNKKTRNKNKQKPGVHPMALPRIRPNVAGIDLGSGEHWVCGPATDDGATLKRCVNSIGGDYPSG